jgi:hypothetical protein
MTADATGPVCVYVVGMHRSGTSATAGVLGQLGLGMPIGEDLAPASTTNERGHWESRSLARFNNRLFGHFGGTWSNPPTLPAGWQDDPSLDGLRAEARRLFEAAFGARPMAFKDPRQCIALPFWQTVVAPPVAALFVFRDPVEVAESLRARSGLRMIHGLALWDRYVRAAAANLEGVPTLAVDYGRILGDPAGWCDELVAFLGNVGVRVDRRRQDEAVAFLDAGLHHHRSDRAAPTGPADSCRRLFEALAGLQGVHDPWQSPPLGPEPDWVDPVLELVGDLERLGSDLETLRKAHASLQRSRALRLSRLLRRRNVPGVDG